jgi:hypothetical protein
MTTDDKIPVGSRVRYHGSISRMHGAYLVTGYSDLSLRKDLSQEQISEHWPDGVAYDLWPEGVPEKFCNRDRALYYIHRRSFTVLTE